jgi:hypothetical protein
MPNPDSAADLELFRAHLPAACRNPGSAALQSGNISNRLRFVADRHMSDVGKRNGGCHETNNRRHCGTAGQCAERARRPRQEAAAGREWARVPRDRVNEERCCALRLGSCQRPEPLASVGRNPKMCPPCLRRGVRAREGSLVSSNGGRCPSPLSKNYQRGCCDLAFSTQYPFPTQVDHQIPRRTR